GAAREASRGWLPAPGCGTVSGPCHGLRPKVSFFGRWNAGRPSVRSRGLVWKPGHNRELERGETFGPVPWPGPETRPQQSLVVAVGGSRGRETSGGAPEVSRPRLPPLRQWL